MTTMLKNQLIYCLIYSPILYTYDTSWTHIQWLYVKLKVVSHGPLD